MKYYEYDVGDIDRIRYVCIGHFSTQDKREKYGEPTDQIIDHDRERLAYIWGSHFELNPEVSFRTLELKLEEVIPLFKNKNEIDEFQKLLKEDIQDKDVFVYEHKVNQGNNVVYKIQAIPITILSLAQQ